MTVKKAVIPCAGYGTRFLPETKLVPKELMPIVDTPALFYVLDEAERSGIKEVLMIISPRKRQIEKIFEEDAALNRLLTRQGKREEYALANRRFNLKISFAMQRKMTGTGGAVALAEEFAAGEPFAVLFGDDVMYTEGRPVTRQLMDAYEETGMNIVGCQRPGEDVARRCGVMLTDGAISDRITRIVGILEKPEGELPSDLVSLGRFIVTPEIFGAIASSPLNKGEKYLTDAISILAKEGKACACEFDARRYDIGNKEGYLEAVTEFALRDKKLSKEYKAYLKGLDLN